MPITLNDAANMNIIDFDSFMKRLTPPYETVTVDAPWSYAVTADKQIVSKDHDWRVEDGRFIASGVWHEEVPDEDAQADLQALIDKWRGEGKEEPEAALNCCMEGIHWGRITKTAERQFSIDVPIETVTFIRYWWDGPISVS